MHFPQAEQIIRRDSFQTGTWSLLLIILAMGAGGFWLFFGTLAFYAVSETTTITADNYIEATFDLAQFEKVQVEQMVDVQFINALGDLMTTPAMVLAIDRGEGVLTLLVTNREDYVALFGGETAVIQPVRLQRQTTTPFQFILEAAGLAKA